jgi:hypothetical protein
MSPPTVWSIHVFTRRSNRQEPLKFFAKPLKFFFGEIV